MAHQQFKVSDTNPNDNTGGGGCICDPLKQTDCKPPYVIFYDTFLEDGRSPFTVACKTCLEGALKACSGEILSIGEKTTLPGQLNIDEVIQIAEADVVEDEGGIGI